MKINSFATEYGREIDQDHFGALFSFCFADSPEKARELASPYLVRRRTNVDHRALSAFGTPEDVRRLIDLFIDAGVTKFAVRPACPTELMLDRLEILGREVVPAYHGAGAPA